MNLRRLHETEAEFLARYPLGFADPGLEVIRKRHNVEQLAKFTKENLTPLTLSQPEHFAEVLVKIIGRASMVSRFEKAPFRDAVGSLSTTGKRDLAEAFEQRLYGRRKHEGFGKIVEFLARYKIARWSLVSAVPFYFAPQREVFVKPTTAKKIIELLEIDNLNYRPRPDWGFYDGYRRLILDIKKRIDPSLTPNNAAVTGLLMVAS